MSVSDKFCSLFYPVFILTGRSSVFDSRSDFHTLLHQFNSQHDFTFQFFHTDSLLYTALVPRSSIIITICGFSISNGDSSRAYNIAMKEKGERNECVHSTRYRDEPSIILYIQY
jgi:hypothetical protein